jgi:2-polyprenyl-3-methyl-5-hydroxy-6-metoxy-1,4-benzoquinol methylase
MSEREINLIQEKKHKIIEQYGEWTAHNIQLDGNLYTIDQRIVGQEYKLRNILQILSDICQEPIANLRILDLACLEGLYAIELARQGAQVVAIEGREANLKKAQFVKDILSLDNLELIQDDVRNLNAQKHGYFDVVLCAGILYHLDAPDVFHFVERIAEVCRRVTLIDTHISLNREECRIYKNKEYWGCQYTEFSAKATDEEKEKSSWSSLDNNQSFWLTAPSLFNLLQSCKFTSVHECRLPVLLNELKGRFMILACKGQHQTVISAPMINEIPVEDYPDLEVQMKERESSEQESNTVCKAELERVQLQLQETQLELLRSQQRIQAMESSKFWHLRKAWFQLKRKVGLPTNE